MVIESHWYYNHGAPGILEAYRLHIGKPGMGHQLQLIHHLELFLLQSDG